MGGLVATLFACTARDAQKRNKEGYRARRSVWGGVQLRSLGSSGSKLKVKIIV